MQARRLRSLCEEAFTEQARARGAPSTGLRMAIPPNRTELDTRRRKSSCDGGSRMPPSSAGISLLWMAASMGTKSGLTAGTQRDR